MDVTSPEDYIGPAKSEPNIPGTLQTEPNIMPKLLTEANIAPSAIPAAPTTPPEPLKITITNATLIGLENNKSLVVQRYNPQLKRTTEQDQLAAFDPDLTIDLANRQSKTTTGPLKSTSRSNTASVGIQEFLPTGTTLDFIGSTNQNLNTENDRYTSQLQFGLTQSLLRGFGTAVNLASVNQARIDTKSSQYELRGFVITLVSQIEETYWDYALALRQIEIFNQSLDVAVKQQQETQERINVGKLAQSELAAAEAEVALRHEDLINARSTLAKVKLNLLQLINPPWANLWDRDIVLETKPEIPLIELDGVEPHVALALKMRSDLNQAKLQWQRDDLEVVKTKNGLLPKLDLFITLGKTGYSESFEGSFKDMHHDNFNTTAGISFEYPPINRSAQARNLRAILTRDQAMESIKNLSQLVEVDVRTAYLEIVRTKEQVAATAATRKLQEEKLRAETEKFRVGKSTSLLVAAAQRDLLSSQITATQSVANYIKAFVELYRLEGSLLERRGVASPGREPVKLSDMPGL
jgi:outer membrane protein TolC